MKRFYFLGIFILLSIFLISCQCKEESFSFVVTADMRYTAKEEFRNSNYFLGACEAIKKFGKGGFMISAGDVDPPEAVYKVVKQILGDDYPWYPVVGNHELEADSNMIFLREYNKNGDSLPHIIRKGPPGCIETTYSFDMHNCHFVVLNQYYDGQSDIGTDGNIVPELMEWLENDLKNNQKKYTFIFGHEPLISIPDMDNGRLRHQDDSLNKYPRNSFQFVQLLKKHNVTAYICGHTHNASIAKINGLWQIDVGHARGIEAFFPTLVYESISANIEESERNDIQSEKPIAEYFTKNAYEIKKVLYYSGLTGGVSYKEIDDQKGIEILSLFLEQFSRNPQLRDKYIHTFWGNASLARSTFLKVITSDKQVEIEFYRDDARGGKYSLMHTQTLN